MDEKKCRKIIEHFKDIVRSLKYDSLTGFLTRTYFDKILFDKAEKRLIQEGGSIVHYDLNNLKLINTQYGYEAGDLLIKYCAKRIKVLGGFGIYVRLGGDEFLSIHFGRKYDG